MPAEDSFLNSGLKYRRQHRGMQQNANGCLQLNLFIWNGGPCLLSAATVLALANQHTVSAE